MKDLAYYHGTSYALHQRMSVICQLFINLVHYQSPPGNLGEAINSPPGP